MYTTAEPTEGKGYSPRCIYLIQAALDSQVAKCSAATVCSSSGSLLNSEDQYPFAEFLFMFKWQRYLQARMDAKWFTQRVSKSRPSDTEVLTLRWHRIGTQKIRWKWKSRSRLCSPQRQVTQLGNLRASLKCMQIGTRAWVLYHGVVLSLQTRHPAGEPDCLSMCVITNLYKFYLHDSRVHEPLSMKPRCIEGGSGQSPGPSSQQWLCKLSHLHSRVSSTAELGGKHWMI